MTIEHAFMALFALMIMQVIGTHLQVKQYRKAVSRLHKLGNLGIGSRRRKLGPGNIVLIACTKDGEITGAEMMQGMTIFSGFTKIQNVVGRNIYELKNEYESLPEKRRSYYKGHIQALEALITRLRGGDE